MSLSSDELKENFETKLRLALGEEVFKPNDTTHKILKAIAEAIVEHIKGKGEVAGNNDPSTNIVTGKIL